MTEAKRTYVWIPAAACSPHVGNIPHIGAIPWQLQEVSSLRPYLPSLPPPPNTPPFQRTRPRSSSLSSVPSPRPTPKQRGSGDGFKPKSRLSPNASAFDPNDKDNARKKQLETGIVRGRHDNIWFRATLLDDFPMPFTGCTDCENDKWKSSPFEDHPKIRIQMLTGCLQQWLNEKNMNPDKFYSFSRSGAEVMTPEWMTTNSPIIFHVNRNPTPLNINLPKTPFKTTQLWVYGGYVPKHATLIFVAKCGCHSIRNHKVVFYVTQISNKA